MESHKKIIVGIIIYGIFLALMAILLDKVISIDKYLFFLLNGLYSPSVEAIFNLITYMGSSAFWLLLIVVFWIKNKKKLSMQLIFAFLIDTVSVAALKYFFLRPRPFEVFQLQNLIEGSFGPSFPSGHTERAFSGAFILSNHYKKYSMIFYALALLVAFSRIYLGFHFPLDTLIGAINGIIVGVISIGIPTKKIEKYLKIKK
jgi:undecaprenyl-diphosphatase